MNGARDLGGNLFGVIVLGGLCLRRALEQVRAPRPVQLPAVHPINELFHFNKRGVDLLEEATGLVLDGQPGSGQRRRLAVRVVEVRVQRLQQFGLGRVLVGLGLVGQQFVFQRSDVRDLLNGIAQAHQFVNGQRREMLLFGLVNKRLRYVDFLAVRLGLEDPFAKRHALIQRLCAHLGQAEPFEERVDLIQVRAASLAQARTGAVLLEAAQVLDGLVCLGLYAD